MLICTPHSLYVFEIGTEKFGYDLYVSAEQQGIFRHEKIAALFTQARTVDASAAGADFPVFHYNTLMAGRWKAVVYDIRKCAKQVENRSSLLFHQGNGITAAGFFFPGKGKLCGIGIRGVEIKRNGPHVISVSGFDTYVTDRMPVNPVYCHIEADIIGGGISYIFHNPIIGVSTNLIVLFFIPRQDSAG